MKKNKAKKTVEHLESATKGMFCSGNIDKDDGMVPCPYCQKKFDPLSVHQYACPLKAFDEKDVKNSALGPSSYADTKGPTPPVNTDGKVPSCPYCQKEFDPLSVHQYACPLKAFDEKDVKNSALGPSSYADTKGPTPPVDTDGKVPSCPYCQKEFDPLSVHQYACPLKAFDEKDVKNSALGPSSYADTKGPTPPVDTDGKVPSCPYCQKEFDPLSVHQYACPLKAFDEKDVKNSALGSSSYADTKGPTPPVDTDGMVLCPYCQKKFDPLSMHQCACQSKPLDEKIIQNAKQRLFFSDVGDKGNDQPYWFSESEQSKYTDNDVRFPCSSDEEDLGKATCSIKRNQYSKSRRVSRKSITKEPGIDSCSENTDKYASKNQLKSYDVDIYKMVRRKIIWGDSPRVHRIPDPLEANNTDFIIHPGLKMSLYNVEPDENWMPDMFLRRPKCLENAIEVLTSSEDTDEDEEELYSESNYTFLKNGEYGKSIIKAEETKYCTDKVDDLMQDILRRLNDRTRLSWVKKDSGSHYSNVKLPNEMEFDYLLCPTQVQCRIEPSSDHPCYCRVFITNKLKLPLEFQEILGPHDELTPSKFKEYVFGILDQIPPQNQLLNRIENKSISPAYTIAYKIGRTRFNENFQIDLVPCLEVQEPPDSCMEWETRMLTEEEKKACPLYVVAKNFDNNGEELELWRLSYSSFELKILHDKCNEDDRHVVKVLKHIIKMVFGKDDSRKLCSYHVTSHCLHYFEKNSLAAKT